MSNKMKKQSQFIVRCFLYDENIYHVEENVNATIVEIIENNFGKLASTTDKKNTFLGMNIEFIVSRKVSITTENHIE